ncbi:hypothetical protein B0H94_10236 [Salsuginibacillus halophilus]|uniref:Pyridoxal phosphate homeostasis protein n=1 Tax=Salsuginibacillus halophilus TaxID=517424 RepID=A0A2P8HX09_9BACI|nr:YggS family pyridoxal phosphate-dependent enzyme [Salsuginibacillus halophilus]PSL50760.1 hypothetical protein B0H94_10236 [Salsuginibacillus halophilus]
MSSVSKRYSDIHSRIEAALHRAGRPPGSVGVIGVTKYVTKERAKEAVEAGITHLGENRPDGLLEKEEALASSVVWHYIGQLQSRKVKEVAGVMDMLHALDRHSLAKELEKRLPDGDTLDCFVQVNVSGEASKSGLAPEEVEDFIRSLGSYEKLRIRGLMTMAPAVQNPEDARPFFRELRKIRDDVKSLNLSHAPCTELSMGMSNDFEVAVEEGAAWVRLGSSLVGPT